MSKQLDRNNPVEVSELISDCLARAHEPLNHNQKILLTGAIAGMLAGQKVVPEQSNER